jgi:hypothetical protein
MFGTAKNAFWNICKYSKWLPEKFTEIDNPSKGQMGSTVG